MSNNATIVRIPDVLVETVKLKADSQSIRTQRNFRNWNKEEF